MNSTSRTETFRINSSSGNASWNNSYEDYYIYSDSCEDLQQEFPKFVVFFKTLLPIVCCLGIMGIILTMIILSHKSMSTSTNAYLLSMATADLFFLFILSTKYFEDKFSNESHYAYIIYFTYADIFLQVFFLASIWLTVMLAIERYIAICHPLRAMVICTVRRARWMILVIFVFSFICRAPIFWHYRLMKMKHSCYNKEIRFIHVTELGSNIMYLTIYSWIVDCTLSAIIPFSLLLFLNCCLIYEIHKSTRHLRYHLAMNMTIRTIVYSEQMKITMMLVSIIIVFFICQAPYVTLNAIKSLVAKFRTDRISMYYHILVHVTGILMALKSSFNFILYCWFSEKFWNTFKRLFCIKYCARCKKNMQPTSEHGTNGSNSMRKISVLNTRETIC